MLRFATFLLFSILVCSTGHAQTQQIRMAVFGPPGTPIWRGAELYQNEINKQLEGRARIEVTSYRGPNVLAALQAGELDLAIIGTSRLAAGKSERLALYDLPFFFQSLTELAAMQHSAIGDATLNAVNAEQLVGLAHWNTGMSHFFGSKSVSKIEDFKGLKLRTTVSPPGQTAAQWLGAETPVIPTDEILGALRERKIDVVEAPAMFVSDGLVKISARNYTSINYRPVVSVVVASEKFWKTLRLRVQSALIERARGIAIRVNADAQAAEQTAANKLQKEFITVTPTPTQFRVLSDAALPAWRTVASLQKDGFLDAALNTRDELRRVKYTVPEKRSQSFRTRPLTKTIFFATDRSDEKDPDPSYKYGGARGDLTWGKAHVEEDPNRPLGSGDTDSVRLVGIIPRPTEAAFVDDLKEHLDRTQQKAVLVYVHGFKTTFKVAVETAAQIVADIRFDGATVVFTWPSDGTVIRYPSDEEEVQGSKDNFITTLKALSGIASLKKTHVVTHSMGGRLAANSLEWLITQPVQGRPRLYHLILAAPDIRVGLFKQAASGMYGLSKKVTLYSSDRDQALRCSQFLHNAQRAGQGGANVVVLKNIDTIDASAVEGPSSRGPPLPCTSLGHSYISHNPAVLGDVYELLTYDADPRSRQRLREQQKDGLTYWVLR